MDELLDISSVAEYLGVSERTVYDRVRSGELAATRVGRLWRVKRADLESWLDARRTGPATARADDGAGENRSAPTRAELEAALEGLDDQLERRLMFVGMLSRAVTGLRWPAPVVVGGNAVEFYTGGDYATVDIDLVGATEPLETVLGGWGFPRQGRHWVDSALGLVVEAPSSRLGEQEQAHVARIAIAGESVLVLGIEDLIVDRLNAATHWNDEESLLWAEALVRSVADLDLAYLQQRAADGDVAAALETILTAAGGSQ